MVTSKVVISDPAGMHARPAGELVKIVKSFPGCSVTLETPTRKINAASMLSVLSLGLKCGAEFTVAADGGNEAEALEALCTFIGSMK